MSTQYAIQIQGPKDARLVSNAPIPKPLDDEILVKTVAVGLNPTDWKHVDFLADPGAIVGCDYSGTVEEVGKSVTGFQKGDKVAGMVHGSNAVKHSDGTFQEHLVAVADQQIKIPSNLSFEEAATLGVALPTNGLALYYTLGLPLPTEPAKEPFPILIYGGSTGMGMFAVQFAKASGLTVVATSSPRNFDLVKKLGADAVFDYNDPASPAKIREFTGDKLAYAMDTIASETTAKFICDSLSTKGGKYVSLLPIEKFPRSDVENLNVLAYTTFGRDFKLGVPIPANPEHRAFGKKWLPIAAKVLAEGKVKVPPLRVGKDGLKGVLEGLDVLRNGKNSGEKLVYRVAETPK